MELWGPAIGGGNLVGAHLHRAAQWHWGSEAPSSRPSGGPDDLRRIGYRAFGASVMMVDSAQPWTLMRASAWDA